jgi:hypothetical protein
MKTKLVLFILLALNVSTFAQGFQNYATIPPDFSKLSFNEANQAVESEETSINAEKVKKIGPEYIANLVAQLQSGHLNSDNKTLAIYFLGSLRPSGTNAINFLIENIDFKATKFDQILKTRIDIERWGEYPSVDALIRIGKPAVNPILDDLPKENGALRRSLLCDVLKKVLRNYLASPQ